MTYTSGAFPVTYTPTIFDNKEVYVDAERERVKLSLCDTAGQEDYDNLRPLSYNNTDVLLIFFDVTSRASFQNVDKRWLPEAERYTSCVWILVGAKADTCEEKREVDEDVAKLYAKSKGASSYIEVSALKNVNVKELFRIAVREALKDQKAQLQSVTHRKYQYRFHQQDTCRLVCQTGCSVQ